MLQGCRTVWLRRLAVYFIRTCRTCNAINFCHFVMHRAPFIRPLFLSMSSLWVYCLPFVLVNWCFCGPFSRLAFAHIRTLQHTAQAMRSAEPAEEVKEVKDAKEVKEKDAKEVKEVKETKEPKKANISNTMLLEIIFVCLIISLIYLKWNDSIPQHAKRHRYSQLIQVVP